MAEIYQLPENNGGSGLGNIPFSIPIGGFGGFGGFGNGFGYGMNGIADLFGLAIIDAYNVPYYSEDAAYLSGFLMRQLVEEIGEPCF